METNAEQTTTENLDILWIKDKNKSSTIQYRQKWFRSGWCIKHAIHGMSAVSAEMEWDSIRSKYQTGTTGLAF